MRNREHSDDAEPDPLPDNDDAADGDQADDTADDDQGGDADADDTFDSSTLPHNTETNRKVI